MDDLMGYSCKGFHRIALRRDPSVTRDARGFTGLEWV
jgi:hypothetical protein